MLCAGHQRKTIGYNPHHHNFNLAKKDNNMEKLNMYSWWEESKREKVTFPGHF